MILYNIYEFSSSRLRPVREESCLVTGLNHIQTTSVLLSVSLLFIALGIIGRNWNIWVLLAVDFSIATCLTLLLWRIINKKMLIES